MYSLQQSQSKAQIEYCHTGERLYSTNIIPNYIIIFNITYVRQLWECHARGVKLCKDGLKCRLLKF